jgi:hypothetical protein
MDGTYLLDTAKHAWTHVGEWTLPFLVEYLPELKLWFGLCVGDMRLGVADLSSMGMDFMQSQQLQLAGAWKEFEAPPRWMEFQVPHQLVSMGFGRFCVARFFFLRVVNFTNLFGFVGSKIRR